MLHQLLTHSTDLKRLRDEKFSMEISGGYLVIHHIPYLNSKKEFKYGSLVCHLDLIGNKTNYIRNNGSSHVMYFIGEFPCDIDGVFIPGLRHNDAEQVLNSSLTVSRSFSNKPEGDYVDYYEKVKRYVELISNPAKYLYPEADKKYYTTLSEQTKESVFHYQDTNSTRANIEYINEKLTGLKIGIIGVGGTGSYILDLVAKCPVQEIHLFDGDKFEQHNAFRFPGAVHLEEIEKQQSKVELLKKTYSVFRKNIITHDFFITNDNIHELCICDFVFISIDKNVARNLIKDFLVTNSIPFIDVGLGVTIEDDKLVCALKVTSATQEKNDHLAKYRPSEEIKQDEYASNIQIADLNSVNAALAVIKWKKIFGFYADTQKEHHSIFTTSNSKIISDDFQI